MKYNKQIVSISSSKYILGDSLNELKRIEDQSIDMVFSDPHIIHSYLKHYTDQMQQKFQA